jgi:hypothetical protein
MSETFKFGNTRWAVKENSILAYNDENNNFKPLPFDFTRASTATRVNENGLIEVVKSGIPRIDYLDNPSGHLLLEPARTNLIDYSEDITNYTKNSINFTNNDNISPDGYQNATKLETTNTGQCHIRRGFTASSTGNYIGSIFLKKQDFNYIYTELGGAYAWFNIGNGTIGNSGNYGSDWTYVSHSIEDYGNGWYRCVIIGNCLNTGTYNYRPVQMVSANGSYNSNLIGGVTYLFGTQVELGSYATSYIPTNGTTETRVAETCTGAGNAQVFNDSEGVLFANVAALANDLTFRQIAITEDVSLGDVLSIDFSSSSNGVRIYARINGSAKSLSSTVSNELLFNKIAAKFNISDFSLFINGEKKQTTTFGLGNFTFKSMFFNNGFGSSPFYGKIKQIGVYDTALTDDELETLTT